MVDENGLGEVVFSSKCLIVTYFPPFVGPKFDHLIINKEALFEICQTQTQF